MADKSDDEQDPVIMTDQVMHGHIGMSKNAMDRGITTHVGSFLEVTTPHGLVEGSLVGFDEKRLALEQPEHYSIVWLESGVVVRLPKEKEGEKLFS